MRFHIVPKSPFSFNLVSSLYSRFPIQCVDLYDKGLYERALEIDGKIHLIRVKSIGTVDKPRLLIDVLPDPKNKRAILEKIKWMLGIDYDLSSFYKIARKDKRFYWVITKLYGLSAPKTPSVFEALIIAITEQQIALPVAVALRQGLVMKYGKCINIEGKKYYTFPSPESLAKAKPEDIRKLRFSSRKSEYMVDISKLVANKDIDLESMKDWITDRIMETLTKIRGVGPWTVEYMMCRGMGRYDALPASDIGLRAGATAYLDKKERISETEVRNLLKPFDKYRGFAAFYLIYFYALKKYINN